MPEPTRYRTRTGHNWAPHIRREPGEDVTDMPAADRAQELADGTIEAYTPDGVSVAHLDDLPDALQTWGAAMEQMKQTAQDALDAALDRATQQQAALTSAEADAQSAVAEATAAVADQQAVVTSLQTQYRAWQTAADPPPTDDPAPESEAP